MITRRSFIERIGHIFDTSCVEFTYSNHKIAKSEDVSKLKFAYKLFLAFLWDTTDPCELSYPTLIQLSYKLCQSDIQAVSEFLSQLWKQTLHDYPNHVDTSLFKGVKLGESLYSGHLTVPYKRISKTHPGDFKVLASFCQFFSRLNLTLDIEEELIREYEENEARLSSLHFDQNHEWVQYLKKYCERTLKSLDLKDLYPKHGSGSVADPMIKSLLEKYQDLSTDQLLSYVTKYDVPKTLDRVSRTIFVPKSIKTYRVISMEPSTLQFWQQAVMVRLYKHMSKSIWFRHHIRLQDQNHSREAARKASITRDKATIDLSKASDSVSYELVKLVMKDTELYKWLVSTRSRSTLLPNGKVIDLKKFAPMGSALCFPIECIIFSGICSLCHFLHPGLPVDYTVYGDDIIIHKDLVETLFQLLTFFGFLVNEDKSHFSTSDPFRESCGGDFLDGQDVSPLRLPRNFSNEMSLEALQDLYNRFPYKGFRSTILGHIDTRGERKNILFSDNLEKGFLSTHPTNFHVKSTWSQRYQRFDYIIHRNIPKFEPLSDKSIDQEAALLHWLLCSPFSSEQNQYSVTKSKRVRRALYIPDWAV